MAKQIAPILGIDPTKLSKLKKKRCSLTSYLNHASNLGDSSDGF